MRGDLDAAEHSIREAMRLGREPQPGLALLRLAQGRVDAALTSIQAALSASGGDRLRRARLCVALVDIALAAGDVDLAASASAELSDAAATYGSSGLHASALHARGGVLLARGEAAQAHETLRAALIAWQNMHAPYAAARVRLLLSGALRAMGDDDAARLEREAAAAAFAELGTTADLRALGERTGARAANVAGLTPRECEVLRLAATGMRNSDIADALVLSVRTVERHLATVYQKLGLQGRNARAAAVSYALREELRPA